MSDDPSLLLRIQRLERGCRIGFLSVTFLFAYFAIRISLGIGRFDLIFKDMLNGKDLPFITQIVILGQPFFILLSFGLPLTAAILAFSGLRGDRAIIGISICSALLLALSIFLWTGLMEPFFSIIEALTASG